MNTAVDDVASRTSELDSTNWSEKPAFIKVPYAPPEGRTGGIVDEVCIVVGELVQAEELAASIHFPDADLTWKQFAKVPGIVVFLGVVPGEQAPAGGEPTHVVLNPESAGLLCAVLPEQFADKDSLSCEIIGQVKLDQADVVLPTTLSTDSESASEGVAGAFKRAAGALLTRRKTAQQLAAEQSAALRTYLPALIERARSSCFLRTTEEAVVWEFTYGPDRQAAIEELLKDLASHVEKTVVALETSPVTQNDTDFQALVDELIGQVPFDWRRSKPFLSAFLNAANQRFLGSDVDPETLSLWRFPADADVWFHLASELQQHFGIAIGRFYLHQRLVTDLNTLLPAAWSHGEASAGNSIHLREAAWNSPLFHEIAYKVLLIEALHGTMTEAFESAGEKYSSFAVAWCTAVSRAQVLCDLESCGGTLKLFAPDKLVEATHARLGIALEFTEYQSRHGMRRIDGTNIDDAMEMSAEEYGDWCGTRTALGELLSFWLQTLYPSTRQQLRAQLGAAQAVGEVELAKQEIADLEGQKYFVERALKGYREADQCRARYFQLLAHQAAAEEEAELQEAEE